GGPLLEVLRETAEEDRPDLDRGQQAAGDGLRAPEAIVVLHGEPQGVHVEEAGARREAGAARGGGGEGVAAAELDGGHRVAVEPAVHPVVVRSGGASWRREATERQGHREDGRPPTSP